MSLAQDIDAVVQAECVAEVTDRDDPECVLAKDRDNGPAW
jgi:hypothetical protein